MTIGHRWVYYRGDDQWKSATQLIRNLVSTASGAGNYLLNVGPMADGTVPELAAERLREMGRWLRVHGESIYGTEPTRLGCHHTMVFGSTTVRGSTLYLHLFIWPGGEFCFAGLKNRVIAARCVTTGDTVRFEQRGDRLFLRGLAEAAPDRHDTVIALEVEGTPERDGATY